MILFAVLIKVKPHSTSCQAIGVHFSTHHDDIITYLKRENNNQRMAQGPGGRPEGAGQTDDDCRLQDEVIHKGVSAPFPAPHCVSVSDGRPAVRGDS